MRHCLPSHHHSVLVTFERDTDLFGNIRQSSHVVITALDGTLFKLAPELSDLVLGALGRDSVLDPFLTSHHTLAETLLEAAQFLLDKLLSPKRALLTILHAPVDLVHGRRLIIATLGRTLVHGFFHGAQMRPIDIIDEVLNGFFHFGLRLLSHFVLIIPGTRVLQDQEDAQWPHQQHQHSIALVRSTCLTPIEGSHEKEHDFPHIAKPLILDVLDFMRKKSANGTDPVGY